MIRHGSDLFQTIIGAKDIIKGLMQRGEGWGYFGGSVLCCVVDGRHGAGKWRWFFSVGQGEVAEKEGHPSQLGWQYFA